LIFMGAGDIQKFQQAYEGNIDDKTINQIKNV